MPVQRYSLLLELIRFFLGTWLKLKFRMRMEGLEVLRSLKPPYVIVPNHSNTFDPFFIAIHIKEPVYWVTSDANFRSPWVRFWLGLVSAIPKTKNISDLESVRAITGHIKQGGIVGIFAEGDRTWDGRTLPLIPATAKLIRMMKVPVICPVLKGAFVSLPRWSKRIRRGRLTVDFSKILYPEDYAGKSADDVYGMLSRMIAHDDYAWQSEAQIPFESKFGAETLESVLFVCRSCGAVSSLRSQGVRLHCSACRTEWRHTSMSRLLRIGDTGGDGIDEGTPGDWYAWQKTVFKNLITEAMEKNDDIRLFSDSGVRVFKGFKFEDGEVLGTGEVSLSTHGITMSLKRKGRSGGLDTTVTLFVPVGEISGQNVVFMNQFEFYYKEVLYSFTYEGEQRSGIKWLQAINCLQHRI